MLPITARRRPALLAGLAALLTTLVAVVPAAPPAQAAVPSYVALGDSYASGTGTRSYADSACQRSDYAYPKLIANARGYALNFKACSGATTSTVTKSQLSALTVMNSKISSAAAARGFAFANPTTRFTGHAVCDSVEWINGLSSPVPESYHPNRLGHSSGYTPLVSPLLVG